MAGSWVEGHAHSKKLSIRLAGLFGNDRPHIKVRLIAEVTAVAAAIMVPTGFQHSRENPA